MLKYLDDVPWEELGHCYGPAADLPAAVRALLSSDASERADARAKLASAVVHQGLLYEASPEVVPFLIELVADPAVPERAPLLELLYALSQAGSYHERRAEEQPAEVVASGAYQLELARERGWVEATQQALARGLGTWLSLIGDPDPAVRNALGPLLATHGDDAHAIEATIVALIGHEADATAFTTLLLTPVFLDYTSDSWLAACRGFLRAPDEMRRVVAAAALGFRLEADTPDEALDVLLDAIADPSVEMAAAWERSAWSRDGFVGDLANVASLLGDRRRERVVPALLDAIAATDRGDGSRIAGAALWMALGDGFEATPPADALDELQILTLQALADAPAAWDEPGVIADALCWSAMPQSLAALRAYLADVTGGPLDREVTLELGGHAQTLPLYAWTERFFFELGLDGEGLRAVLAELMAPIDVLEVFGELVMGAHGLDTPRLIDGEYRTGHPQTAFVTALDEALAEDPDQVAAWAEGWLEERLASLRAGDPPTPRNIYGLAALVRARPGQGLHPAYDGLVVPSRWPLALEVLVALPDDRREAVVMRHIARLEDELAGADDPLAGGAEAVQLAPLLGVAPSARVARVLARIGLRARAPAEVAAAIAEHGGQAPEVAAVAEALSGVDPSAGGRPVDLGALLDRFR